MADEYKTSGSFDGKSRKFELQFNVELEAQANPYKFYQKYDISQKFIDPSGKNYTINGILIYIQKYNDPQVLLNSAPSVYDYHRFPNHDLTALTAYNHPNYEFNFNAEDALIILFHETGFDQKDVKHFYDNLKEYYISMKARNIDFDFLTSLPIMAGQIQLKSGKNAGPILGKPRTAGLTIIKRLP